MMKRTPLKFYLIYTVCLAAFLAVATELASRLLFEPQDLEVSKSNSQLVYDPTVGWRARRGLRGEFDQPPYPVPVRVAINADGFRDEDWDGKLARAGASGAKKILLVGDSLVYGWGAEV